MSSTVGVYVARKAPYLKLAKLAVKRFKFLNGYDAQVVTEEQCRPVVRSNWLKAFIWDVVPPSVDRIVYLDLDTFLFRPFDEFPDVPFAAVHDIMNTFMSEKACVGALGELTAYFNSGVMIVRRDAKKVFDEAKKWVDKPCGGCVDQSRLNLIVHSMLGGFHPLPSEWNWFLSRERPVDPIVMHMAGMFSNHERVSALQTLARMFENVKNIKSDW